MKIGVIGLSRTNLPGIITAIHASDALSSGENEIGYFVRYDYDDDETDDALKFLSKRGISIRHVVNERPNTLGEALNEAAACAVAEGFEAISCLSDDFFPLTGGWDIGVKTMIRDRGFDVFAWREMINPTLFTCPVVSAEWMRAAGRLMPEWFPFWFSDTWLSQVYEFAKGSPAAIVADMTMGGPIRVQRTRGMRDMRFWVEFWKSTRSLRIAEGESIRRAMNWPEVDIGPIVEKFERLDRDWHPDEIEAARAINEPGPPSARYVLAKSRAERWLKDQQEISNVA